MSHITSNEISMLIIVLEVGTVIIFSLIVAQVLGKRGIPQVLGLAVSVLIAEIIGPILLKYALRRADEIPIDIDYKIET